MVSHSKHAFLEYNALSWVWSIIFDISDTFLKGIIRGDNESSIHMGISDAFCVCERVIVRVCVCACVCLYVTMCAFTSPLLITGIMLVQGFYINFLAVQFSINQMLWLIAFQATGHRLHRAWYGVITKMSELSNSSLTHTKFFLFQKKCHGR